MKSPWNASRVTFGPSFQARSRPRAVNAAVALQEEAGLEVVTDGEMQASPSVIAGLPSAIFLVFLGAALGKSALETRGLGWAICLHAALDVGSLPVTFVSRG